MERSHTNTSSGIRPIDLSGFIMSQLFGAVCALVFGGWLLRAPIEKGEPPNVEAKL